MLVNVSTFLGHSQIGPPLSQYRDRSDRDVQEKATAPEVQGETPNDAHHFILPSARRSRDTLLILFTYSTTHDTNRTTTSYISIDSVISQYSVSVPCSCDRAGAGETFERSAAEQLASRTCFSLCLTLSDFCLLTRGNLRPTDYTTISPDLQWGAHSPNLELKINNTKARTTYFSGDILGKGMADWGTDNLSTSSQIPTP